MPRISRAAPPTSASMLDGAVADRHGAGQGAGRRGVGAMRATGSRRWLRGMHGCTVYPAATRGSSRAGHGPRSATSCSTAPRIFINVGGRAAVPAMPGVDAVPYLTNTTMLRARPRAAAPRRRRRQLHRARVRADVSPLRRRGDGRRDGAAPDRPRGRGRLARRSARSSKREGIAVRTGAECISFAPHAEGVAVGVDCSDGRPGGRRLARAAGGRAGGRTPTTSASTRPASPTDARGYIQVDDEPRDQRARHLGARRLQRPRRLHPHRLQRFRDRRRQPARRRAPRRVSDRIPAYALYIDPPLGRVGMTEAQARASGRHAADRQAPDDGVSAARSRKARRRAS